MEQLSGALGMATAAPGARLGTLRFLALHAFFAADDSAAAQQV